MLFLYDGNTRTRLRALAAGLIPVLSKLLRVQDTSYERAPQSPMATPPPAIMLSVLTTRP